MLKQIIKKIINLFKATNNHPVICEETYTFADVCNARQTGYDEGYADGVARGKYLSIRNNKI